MTGNVWFVHTLNQHTSHSFTYRHTYVHSQPHPPPHPLFSPSLLTLSPHPFPSLLSYEKIFGEGYACSGGPATTREFVKSLNLRPGDRVLDLGCGLGGGSFHMVGCIHCLTTLHGPHWVHPLPHDTAWPSLSASTAS